MADNVTANAGSGGAVFATDDISSVHYPRTKVCWGPDGTANDADVASGKPLPVQLRTSVGTEIGTSGSPVRTDPTGTTTQPVSGTVTANIGTSGSLATESTLSTLNGKVTACNTGAVVVSGALPAGDNAIGRVKLTDGTEVASVDTSSRLEVAVNNTPTVNIGTAGTLALESSLSALNGKVTACNTGAVAGTVTANLGTIAGVATESTLSTLNGKVTACNTGAVAGTVTANIGTSGSLALESSLSSLNGKVTACNTGAIAGTVTANAGTGSFTVAQGTAANLKSEAQGPAATGAAVSGNPLLAGTRATTSELAKVDDGDVVPIAADATGRVIVSLASAFDNQVNARANLTDTTDTQLIALDASYKYAVMAVLVTNAHATIGTKVSIRDGTTDKLKGYAAPAGGGFSFNGGGVPLFIGTVGTALKVQCGTTGADVEVFVTVAKVK